MEKIGFGGGCHWCTEAIFQTIKGVSRVDQGYIASCGHYVQFSEAVVVHFDPAEIQLLSLIKIHLQTHSSTSAHRMRDKYRSEIYTYCREQELEVLKLLRNVNIEDHSGKIITKVLPHQKFKSSQKEFQNYFLRDPGKPFCQTYIAPKLKFLKENYPDNYNN